MTKPSTTTLPLTWPGHLPKPRSTPLVVAGLSLALISACTGEAPKVDPVKHTTDDKGDAAAKGDPSEDKGGEKDPAAVPVDPAAQAANCCLFCMDGKSPCGA